MADEQQIDPASIRPGIFGRYCLLERLSVGGMAEVFRARPFYADNFSRFLAIKRILPHLAGDAEFIEMFVDEARITVQLNHPNICQLYELGRYQGAYFIVMEYIAGRDLLALQNYYRRSRQIMPPTQAAWIAAAICDGLDYAYRKRDESGRALRIIHRDISPQNVIVTYDGEVKLIDFGIARADVRRQRTQVGVLKGKFGYMSPEQVLGHALDNRSDVFALGILFWELLTGRRLFYSKNDYEILDKVRHMEAPPPSQRNALVPPEVDRIVARALAKNRAERYRSAAEFAADLRGWLKTVQPPYLQRTMSRWMQVSFAEELRLEQRKIQAFEPFIRPRDVIEHLERFNLPMPDGVLVEDDQTDLSDDDLARLDTAVTSGKLELLAENEERPLPTVIGGAVKGDTGLPLDDDEDEDEEDLAEASMLRRIRRSDALQRRRLLALVAFALLLTLVFGIVVLQARTRLISATVPGRGDVVVQTDPVPGLRVEVAGAVVEPREDGRYVAEGLQAGPVVVRLQAPGHVPRSHIIHVEASRSVTWQGELEPERLGRRQYALPIAGLEDVSVWVNGVQLPTSHTGLIELSPDEDAVVELVRPGYLVERVTLQGGSAQDGAVPVVWREASATLVLTSDPAAEVRLDGERVGETTQPVVIDGLDPWRIYDLELVPLSPGFLPYRDRFFADGGYNRQLRVQPRRIGQRADPVVQPGLLEVRTDEFAVIEVDGRDTGLAVPFAEGRRLPLRPGEREVVLRRGQRTWSTTVTVPPGQVVRITVPARALSPER